MKRSSQKQKKKVTLWRHLRQIRAHSAENGRDIRGNMGTVLSYCAHKQNASQSLPPAPWNENKSSLHTCSRNDGSNLKGESCCTVASIAWSLRSTTAILLKESLSSNVKAPENKVERLYFFCVCSSLCFSVFSGSLSWISSLWFISTSSKQTQT